MRLLFTTSLSLALALIGCAPDSTKGPLDSGDGGRSTDSDGDGVGTADDCDDTDPTLGAISEDGDCDGALTADDCDDGDPAVGASEDDADCDGFVAADDCDDGDASSTVVAEDGDCDGALTADDCDDGDADSTVVAEDADCDGALTADDCDDGDASSTARAEDGDCDGTLTADDCDDADPALNEVDADADGHTSCGGDCDDGDGSIWPGAPEGLLDGDSDCDGQSSEGGSLADADYSFIGEDIYNDAGARVASAGDVDGDGLDDVLVAAYSNSAEDNYAGRVYLFLGAELGAGGERSLADADYTFTGLDNYDYVGHGLASAGDVDGDGLDDLLIGAFGADHAGAYSGAAYVILGKSLGAGGELSLNDADYILTGEDVYNYAGSSVSSAGDVDGDGLDDLLIAASWNSESESYAGKIYLVLASSLGAEQTLSLSDADYGFLGEDVVDFVGEVASAGDVDGDGLDDVLVGGDNNSAGGDSRGKTYLILGASLGASGTTTSLADVDYRFTGEEDHDYAGCSVAGAGDVDGDGLADILIGAWGNDDGDTSAGKTYLILGASLSGGGDVSLADADYTFQGGSEYEASGHSVAWGGDLNSDGFDDILIGAPYSSDGAYWGGAVYVILGDSLGAFSTISLSDAPYSLLGENSDDYAGWSVAGAGDVNGDGRDDVLTGAYENDDGGYGSGKAYLILSGL